MNKHIAVLYGGLSSEREVSLSSGKACCEAIESLGYEATLVDVGYDLANTLLELKPDIAFNALHGTYGEDGTIQGVLEFLKIPYTHSGVRASAIAMDKHLTRMLAKEAGVAIAKAEIAHSQDEITLPPPYVVKPVADGSSVGIQVIKEGEKVKKFTGAHLVEAFINGLELTCGVLDGKAMDIIEIRPKSGFYDYENKYTAGNTEYIIPADIPDDVYQCVQNDSVTMHRILGCRGVTRSDFRYDPETETLVFLEINTHPGMTDTSLVPKMAAYQGMSFPELMDAMIQLAQLDHNA